jgi:hypothetical protein
MKTLGQLAYEAGLLELLKHGHYEGEHGEHVTPTWDSIGEAKRKAWAAAAEEVIQENHDREIELERAREEREKRNGGAV